MTTEPSGSGGNRRTTPSGHPLPSRAEAARRRTQGRGVRAPEQPASAASPPATRVTSAASGAVGSAGAASADTGAAGSARAAQPATTRSATAQARPMPARRSTRATMAQAGTIDAPAAAEVLATVAEPAPEDTSSDGEKEPVNAKKKKGKWGRRLGLGFVLTVLTTIIVGLGGFLYMYVKAEVPAPDQFALAQTTKVYYVDGTTEMGTLSEVNRKIIDTSTLPDYISKAVVASEDRTFYTNSGIDLRGIARALVTNITTGTRQGGSTLTQQYVERYYMGDTTTYVGKLKEAVLAVKINREQTKDQILGNYLNTIYFGRGAYGIEAASQAFFGHPATEMTLSEAALISGIIPAPSAWDPAEDPEQAQSRWRRVLDLMVEDGWISASEAAAQTFPETIDPGSLTSETYAGPNGYLVRMVRSELVESGAFTEEQIDSGGLKIVTTIDKAKQEAAVAAAQLMNEVEGWDNATMRTAITSLNPTNGEIVALYGGADYLERQQNAATQDIAAAGSTFKLFALMAHIRENGSLNDYVDGSSPRSFAGLAAPVQNDGGVSWGRMTVLNAFRYSANTAFVELNEKVGSDKTLQAALDAGIPEDTIGLESSPLNVLGYAAPHNIDLARAFSTVANGGTRINPHIVREVYSSDGDKVFATSTVGTEAFTSEQMSAILPALEAVTASGGTADKVAAARLGFPTGGKTGTSEDQKSALFVGFVPELVTAVSQYGVDADGNPMELPNIGGVYSFHGGDWPTDVWLKYMEAVAPSLTVTTFDWYRAVQMPQSAATVETPQSDPAQQQPTTPTPTTPTTPSDPGTTTDPEQPSEEPTDPTDPGGGGDNGGDNGGQSG